MFGPLPALHRLVIMLTAIGVCIGIGAWLGFEPEFALNVPWGLVAGSGAGLATAFVLLHDFHGHDPRAVSVQHRRR